MTFEERVEKDRVWLVTLNGCPAKPCRHGSIHSRWTTALTYADGDRITLRRKTPDSPCILLYDAYGHYDKEIHLKYVARFEPDVYVVMKAMGTSKDDAFMIAMGLRP